jgi:hypothetical protein
MSRHPIFIAKQVAGSLRTEILSDQDSAAILDLIRMRLTRKAVSG